MLMLHLSDKLKRLDVALGKHISFFHLLDIAATPRRGAEHLLPRPTRSPERCSVFYEAPNPRLTVVIILNNNGGLPLAEKFHRRYTFSSE